MGKRRKRLSNPRLRSSNNFSSALTNEQRLIQENDRLTRLVQELRTENQRIRKYEEEQKHGN